MTQGIVDKRSAKRKISHFPIRYHILGREDAPSMTALSVDLSSRSVAFEVQELFQLGTRIEAELMVPSLPHAVKIRGKVNRIEETARKRYLHSVLFEEIKKEDQTAIEKYVQLLDIDSILRLAVKRKASSLHMVSGHSPIFRIEGEIFHLDILPISAEDLKRMVLSMVNEKQRAVFNERLELDFSYFIPEGTRFRVNMFLDRGCLSAVFRIINNQIRTFAELGLPGIADDMIKRRKGLIMVTGPVDSGKSTTLAAMIDKINHDRESVVISIEDPIEYVHKNIRSIIHQREVGTDTLSFANALRHVLRQDADVILVGEMRDLESISKTITAAETGQLVMATLHTPDTVECINRIIDVYPAAQQEQVRVQLASCIECIIGQHLIPRRDGTGRVLASEVLVATPAIRNLIRSKQTEQIHAYLEAGGEYGMHTMDSSLLKLVQDGIVDREIAIGYAKNKERFQYV